MATYSEHEQRELDQNSGPTTTGFADRYIGDGVYASFDGYQIWVKTTEGHRIALEPPVMAQLKQYEIDLYRHYGRDVP